MKPLLLLLLLVPLAFRAPQSAAAPTQATPYSLDPVHSTVLFKVKHLETSWSYGRFNTIAGELSFDEQKPETSTVKCTIDVDSIDTNSKERDGHLKSPDFFSAREFPKITFKSTRVARKKEAYSVSGELTLHGVTKSVTFEMQKVGQTKAPEPIGERIGFFAVTTIKRSEFGMESYLDMLSDEVEVTLSIEGTK